MTKRTTKVARVAITIAIMGGIGGVCIASIFSPTFFAAFMGIALSVCAAILSYVIADIILEKLEKW